MVGKPLYGLALSWLVIAIYPSSMLIFTKSVYILHQPRTLSHIPQDYYSASNF
ncbi:hypothetical protein AHAS_Ahas15G0191000 [Arachis hypogaea]